MIDNIPFWKVATRNGKVVAIALYKDKSGRKRVAAATDGSYEGKSQLAKMQQDDITKDRSYSEVSAASLNYILKRYKGSDITKYMILPQDAEKILKGKLDYPVSDEDPEVVRHPELKKYFYQRQIGGVPHTKLMIGTPNKKIS